MVRKRDASSACVRAFALLEVLAAEDGPVALADLASRVGLPKATVHRLLAQLAGAGLVGREPERRRFAVGARFSALALRVLANSTHRGVRRAILQGLVDELGETCNLTMLDGAEIVYLDRVDTPSPLRVNLQPGSKVPLHCTASGKLLLALLPAQRRARIVRHLRLEARTANTITARPALETTLKRIRRERLSTDAEEFITGLVCVAVPILAADGRALAAVAMQAPVARMPLERALRHATRLREAAGALAGSFG